VVLVLIPVSSSFAQRSLGRIGLSCLEYWGVFWGGGGRDGRENDGGKGEGGAVRGWGLLVGGWVIRGGEGGMDVRGREKR